MDKTMYILFVVLAVYFKSVHCALFRYQDGRIVGGSETNITSYPYAAYLIVANYFVRGACTGIIISNTHVLTAAHCLSGMDQVVVRIGSTYSDKDYKQYIAKNFTSHPEYHYESDYDVGLIRTPKMHLDGTYAKAAKLAKSGFEPEYGTAVDLAGWGRTEENGKTSEILKYTTVKIVNREECQSRYEDIKITSRMICAGVKEGGKDACQGDSGGPLVLHSNKHAIGIVSFSDGCARPNQPGVYAAIGNPEIRKFIKDISGV